ncbi:hypothetical protein KUTeg_013015 [Tegillarca granosa]|uniref:tRNA/rRNA methyltransferase SpoU type domain-containing protein n=1 Tax=Tegillarca granosa TaxID=220873 RepID=A0ABQ9EVZ4_TEGGR|nr:hypothetical protein KUTeg_013015 [Tegillarca granosa]
MAAVPGVTCLHQYDAVNIKDGLLNLTESLQKNVENKTLLNADFSTQLQTYDMLIKLLEIPVHNTEKSLPESHFENVIYQICIPALKQIHPSFDNRRENYVLISQICSVLMSCLKFTKIQVISDILKLCDDSFTIHVNEKSSTVDRTLPGDQTFDVHCGLDIIRNYLTIHKLICKPEKIPLTEHAKLTLMDDTLESIYTKLLAIVLNSENVIVIKMALVCISSFMKLNAKKLSERLIACWEIIWKIWKEDEMSYKPNMLLCGLANYYFPLEKMENNIDVRQKNLFWKIIQSGIPNRNTLVRKQSVYLLKRIVDTCERLEETLVSDMDNDQDSPLFSWNRDKRAQLSKVWEDFLLLVETLEEKQVHVVKPLLPRMQSLIQAASQEDPLLHTSWLIAVLKQAFIHESLFLQRWAVDVVLSFDFHTCPIIRQGQDQYFSGEFLFSLQEPKLYIRPLGSPLGSNSDCAEKLRTFLPSCCAAFRDNKSKTTFVSSVLKTVCSSTWGPAPLLFMCQALSHIPKAPLLDKDSILNLRKIVGANISTVTPYIRGAIQCFCAQTLINLIDLEKITASDFFPILVVFNQNESLQRGTTLWKLLSDWLQEAVQFGIDTWSPDSILKIIDNLIVNYLQVESEGHYSPSQSECCQISRMMLLSADAGILPVRTSADIIDDKDMTSVTSLIGRLTDIISAVNVRAYMSPVKAEKALELLLSIYGELRSTDDVIGILVKETLTSCFPEMITFIQRLLISDWRMMEDLSSIDLCTRVISLIDKKVGDCMKSLVEASISTLSSCIGLSEVSLESQMKIIGAGSILATIASHIDGQKDDSQQIVTSICNFTKTINIRSTFDRPPSYDSKKEWGRMTSRFMTNQWQLIHLCLNTGNSIQISDESLLDLCFECLSVGLGDTLSPLFKCIQILLPKILASGNTQKVIETLKVTWSCVDEVKRKTNFWDILREFVSLAYQPDLLQLPDSSQVTDKLLEYADMLMTTGEEREGIANMLISWLVTVWRHKEMMEVAAKYYTIIVEACTYGVLKKKARQMNDVYGYLDTLGNQCSVNELLPNIATSDIKVRVMIINFLCELKPLDPSHQKFCHELLSKLTEKYRYIMKNSAGHTYINMHSHRLRERTQQIIIMLEPFITEINCQEMWDYAWECLTQEPQPSVRHLLEWLILRLAHRFPKFINDLWTFFSEISEKKSFTICSIMSVLSHLGPHLSGSTQVDYYNKGIPQILPWCMCHHFNTRIYAQALICKLWKQCENFKLHDVLKTNHIVKNCLVFNSDTNKSTKLVRKLLQNYFFYVFDFCRDYSMETIFYTLPKLSEYSDDEWITPGVFQKINPETWSSQKQCSFIPLYNRTSDLSTCNSGPWKVKVPDTLLGEGDNDDEEIVHSDVQKKITPWRMMTPDDETLDELLNSKNIQKTEGLILVTSLIDKVPNLGEYLQQKRQEGYTLVGVEQTANSVSLTDFQFPVKTLLLLGNEKEGIPVELINSLDVCVEIPQQGVIRSLNVHVSGALLVWEYRRQQLIKEL